uniref:Uncharacterized protein n=1 Tax=Amphilophus citrinellus TaxID=61819 RepID=A0A3Q0QRM5_AMPCI
MISNGFICCVLLLFKCYLMCVCMLQVSEVMSEQGILYVAHMLITTGLAACCINFLGGKICLDCTDTNKFLRWKLVMMPYIICTFFFTSCVLAGALMCYGIRNQLEESLFLGLRNAMRYYKDTDTPGRCNLKRTVDLVQIEFQCCGNTGYQDWFQIQWISSRLCIKHGGALTFTDYMHINVFRTGGLSKHGGLVQTGQCGFE